MSLLSLLINLMNPCWINVFELAILYSNTCTEYFLGRPFVPVFQLKAWLSFTEWLTHVRGLMRRRVKGTGGEEKIRGLRKTLKNAAIDIRNLVRMRCSNSPFYLLPSPDFLQRGIFPALHPEAHYPALLRERVNNIMQEVWHKASPNNRDPLFLINTLPHSFSYILTLSFPFPILFSPILV